MRRRQWAYSELYEIQLYMRVSFYTEWRAFSRTVLFVLATSRRAVLMNLWLRHRNMTRQEVEVAAFVGLSDMR
jgi:hypothetical protein